MKATLRASEVPAIKEDAQAVYAGRALRGNIVKSKKEFLAYDERGKKLGKFPSAAEAMRAVLAAPATVS